MVVSAAAHALVVFKYLIFTRQEKKRIGTGNWKAGIQRCVKNELKISTMLSNLKHFDTPIVFIVK
jgi:hypothetical protein